MQNDIAVSVIVPFYNLENCVDYCLQSLIEQTYSNYEIICVDDGSTDGTLAKLEQYAELYPNVRVLTKANGGLSSARNFAVSHANAEYVTFVDGDDVVSSYYIEALVKGVSLSSSPNTFVLGLLEPIPPGKIVNWNSESICPSVRLLTKEQAAEAIAYEEYTSSACCRLAPKSFYLEMPFPDGRLYEEYASFMSFLALATEVAIIDAPTYGYVMRSGSIVHQEFVKQKQVDDYFYAIERFEAGMRTMAPSAEKCLIFFKSLQYTRIYRLLERMDPGTANLKETKRILTKYVRRHFSCLIGDSRISIGNKIRFTLFAFMPGFYEIFITQYEQKLKF